MNRRQFTANLAKLIEKMNEDGNEVLLDYVLRSAQEQKMLFDKGLSKCDGVKKVSAHQKGLAADIYFYYGGDVDYDYKFTSNLSKNYHDLWVKWGGKPVLDWDQCHYEA